MMLTKREQRLKDEIVSIAELSAMDHWNILDYEKDSRSIRLQIMKRDLINSQIVEKYTYIDELLPVIICHTYFRAPKKAIQLSNFVEDEEIQGVCPPCSGW